MSDSDADQDDILDDDILEIFVEEVDEVIEQIDSLLPQWSEDPADKSAADEIRRAFHTLKGSGRMVKAREISELSCAMEGMLNRVVDGSVPLTDTMLSLVGKASEVIPRLVGAFKNHQSSVIVDVNIDLLVSQANALERGESIDDASPQVPPVLTTAGDFVVDPYAEDMVDGADLVEPFDYGVIESLNERVDSLSDSSEKIFDHMRRLHEELGNIRTDIPAMASDSDIRELADKMLSVNKDVQDLKYFIKTSSEKALEDHRALNDAVASQLQNSKNTINVLSEDLRNEAQQVSTELNSVRASIVRWSMGSALFFSSIAATVVYLVLTR